jgi:CRP-like cAMP-binding protein
MEPVDEGTRQAALSSALLRVFRGRLCESLTSGRPSAVFETDAVLYDVGDTSRVLFFLRRGAVRVGTITERGDEIIYDIRTGGDVVGELCACEPARVDRAVALEETEAVAVPYSEVLESVRRNPDLLQGLVEVFCAALSHAYEQVDRIAVDDTMHRLVKVLLELAAKLGRPAGRFVEIPTYLTQEEIAQMLAARRERVSTALNALRRRGIVRYSRRGHLHLDIDGLEKYPS